MRRLIEPAKSVLIVVLFLTSLGLSFRLWLPPTPATAVREGYRAPFTAPGASAELHWTMTLQPLKLLVHLPGRGAALIDPRAGYGSFLWEAVRGTAAAVPASDLSPVAAGEVDRWRRETARGNGFGIEAALPRGVRLSLWRALWTAAAGPEAMRAGPGTPDPGQQPDPPAGDTLDSALDGPIDQVVVLFVGDDAWLLFHGERGYLGARVAAPQPGRNGDGLERWVANMDGLQQLLRLIASLDPDLEPVEAVRGAPSGLAVSPGVYAPLGHRELPLLQYGPATLSWDRLVRSFFGSAGLTRRVAAGDVLLYTDGEGNLTIRPDEGLAEYQAPPAPAAAQDATPPGPAEALAAAVAFGTEHGGWPDPGNVVLTSVTPVVARGTLSAPEVLGYRFGFMQRIDGYLLADRHLAVVEVDARGVTYWRRRFIESSLADPEGTVAIPIQPAAEAVSQAAELSFETLAESARLVVAVDLVYIRHDRDSQRPAWQLSLHDGTVIWVSAWPGGDIRFSPAAR